MKKILFHILCLCLWTMAHGQIGLVYPDTGFTGDSLGKSTIAPGNCIPGNCPVIALPLHLLDFSGRQEGANNHLFWKTVDEERMSYYEVQRSTGQHFDSIGRVNSLNIAATHQYDFIDQFPAEGKNYYRLKMVDDDGKFTYSKTILLDRAIASFLLLYPNPVKENFSVEIYMPVPSIFDISIIDFTGRAMLRIQKAATRGINHWEFTVRNWSSGKYSFILSDKHTNKPIQTSFIIIK